MSGTEKRMNDILSQDIQVSDVVNQRLKDTYEILERRQEITGKKHSYKKSLRAAAAVAAIVCLAVPSAVYASVKAGVFDGMFGNTTKKSWEIIHKEVDNGKGGTTAVDIPSKEFVPVDESKADEQIGQWVMDEPIVKQIGEHTLTIESFVYDSSGAVMCYTLGRKGGVTALKADESTNVAKGAMFTDEVDFRFAVQFGAPQDEEFIFAGDNTYVDLEKSTDELFYCTSYMLWSDNLKEGDVPQLVITKYPDTLKEIYKLSPDTTGMTKEEAGDESLWKEYNEAMAKVETETIDLSDNGQIPVKTIDMGEKGRLVYSPISIRVDMSKGMGLSEEEAQDPCYMKHMEIKYKDGSSYVVSDSEELIENSGYVLGLTGQAGAWYKTVFNRLVDTDEIAEIIVNDVSFPVE
ncbi:MAG: hypothetical protein K1W22_06880 [Lachnospiraceae bacterium]